MIRATNEGAGKNPKEFNARAVLRSMEKHLSQASAIPNKKAQQAQQLVYDAWEAATDEEERDLMQRALKLNPTNVDALLYVLDGAGLEDAEEIQALRSIVAAGEKDLGPKPFKRFAGSFWGFIETRPYMRARQRLAECLRACGGLEEAVAEYEAMLALNPNDNQGVRYHLLPCYLILRRLEAAQTLFAKYDECNFNAPFAWCRVLQHFLSNDLPGAGQALARARKQNPNMQIYIKGHRELPRELPHAYSPGSKEEALCFAHVLRAAWEKYPEALK